MGTNGYTREGNILMSQVVRASDGLAKTGQRQSFVLRLWCSNGAEATCWQASLENPQTGERIGFTNLEHLFAYLMQLTEGGVEESP